MTGPWTPAEDGVLRREYAGGDPGELARRLGRTRRAVTYRANLLGLHHREPVDTGRVLELIRSGLSDRQAAAKAGCSKEYALQLRQRAKLPANKEPKSAATRAKLAAAMEATRRKYGVTSLRALDPGVIPRRNAALARRYGLPEDLKPVQVRVLVALARGPMTADRLRVHLGCRRTDRTAYHSFGCPKVSGGNYLTDLRKRGLVCLWRPPRKATKGRGQAAGVYVATLRAIELMRRGGGVVRQTAC